MKHRSPALLVALLVAPLLLVACNGEAGPADPTPAVGAYTLHQVNGEIPPVIYYQDATGRYEVLAGSLTLRRDGSYTETATVRLVRASGPPDAPVTNSESGNFRLLNQRVEFRTAAGGLFAGTLAGDTLSYRVGSGSFSVAFVR